ncbi:MAG: hypothetical protein ACRDHO_12960 [Actinomycetota bacterium]
MKTRRFEELIAKRDLMGLSDREADELGRLFAEREGKSYSNASSVREQAHAERMGVLQRFEEATRPAA